MFTWVVFLVAGCNLSFICFGHPVFWVFAFQVYVEPEKIVMKGVGSKHVGSLAGLRCINSLAGWMLFWP